MEYLEEKKPSKFKLFLFRAFEEHDIKDPICIIFDVFYMLLILTSLIFTIIEVTELWERVEAFEIIEYVIVFFFAIEWFSMLYISDIVFPSFSRGKSMLLWISSFESIVDLICLVVFIVSFIPLEGVSNEIELFFRFITLIKLIRVYKWHKYFLANKKRREGTKDSKDM